MCIRDRIITDFVKVHEAPEKPVANYEEWLIASYGRRFAELFPLQYTCLLYTSDAADERSSVDLGGRRIIKKKKHIVLACAANVLNTDRQRNE